MIVFLVRFISLSANNTNVDSLHPSTGDVVRSKDSVLISYDDLRLANSKLIELDYEKQINNNLRNIISNDSVVIRNYQVLNDKLNKDCKKLVNQRNIIASCAALFIFTTIVLLVK